MIKSIVKAITPPIIQSQLKRLLLKKNGYFSGPYANWSTALQHAKGYADAIILDQVKAATLQVKDNRKRFVRDGMVFDEPQYAYPVLAALLKIAAEKNGQLTVVDFGGALGSKYYAFRSFCEKAVNLQWFVVEQSEHAKCGNQFFCNEELSFYEDLQQLPAQPDVILLSGVLQYLPDPYKLLEDLPADYLILDRTWFHQYDQNDCIVVEHVPAHIYAGSYPCWLFNYPKLKAFLSKQYELIDEFAAPEGDFSLNGFDISTKGLFLRRKSA